jgi:UPF0271 protein
MKRIDLNVDVGEGFAYDRDLFEFATSANISCGAHAGSLEITAETIAYCRERGIRFGAHPGYPDPDNFGRKSITSEQAREWLDSIFQQMRAFYMKGPPAYLKPHGGFYNDTAILLTEGWDIPLDPAMRGSRYMAGGVFLAAQHGIESLSMLLRIYQIPLMGLDGTSHKEVARRAGQFLIREGFADRRYQPDGLLVPRSQPGAILEDPAEVAEQVLRLAQHVDSFCLHGDNERSVVFAEQVYRALTDRGYEVGI